MVELKYRGASSDEDIGRIKEYWMGPNLHYRFGASINISNETEYKVKVLHENAEREFNQASSYIPLRSHISAKEINATIKKIFSIKQKDPNADISTLESQIDKTVYEIFDRSS